MKQNNIISLPMLEFEYFDKDKDDTSICNPSYDQLHIWIDKNWDEFWNTPHLVVYGAMYRATEDGTKEEDPIASTLIRLDIPQATLLKKYIEIFIESERELSLREESP